MEIRQHGSLLLSWNRDLPWTALRVAAMASCHALQCLSPLLSGEAVSQAYSRSWVVVQHIPALEMSHQTCSQLAQKEVGAGYSI